MSLNHRHDIPPPFFTDLDNESKFFYMVAATSSFAWQINIIYIYVGANLKNDTATSGKTMNVHHHHGSNITAESYKNCTIFEHTHWSYNEDIREN